MYSSTFSWKLGITDLKQMTDIWNCFFANQWTLVVNSSTRLLELMALKDYVCTKGVGKECGSIKMQTHANSGKAGHADANVPI